MYFFYFNEIYVFSAILMRTREFETRLYLDSNFENYDIELEKYLKTNIYFVQKFVETSDCADESQKGQNIFTFRDEEVFYRN